MERFLSDMLYPTLNLLLGKTVPQITKKCAKCHCQTPNCQTMYFNINTFCKLIRTFGELAVVLLCPIRDPPTTRPHILGSKIPLAQCGILLFPFDCSKDNDILLKSGIVVLR